VCVCVCVWVLMLCAVRCNILCARTKVGASVLCSRRV
jgi:hypothetical protein